jgi:uncharacterized membrane protein
MRSWFNEISEHVSLLLNLAALLLVVLGSIEVLLGLVRLVLRSTSDDDKRLAWLRFGRWLVAALTFQLAADIVESSVTRSWEEIGRLAAVAGVRTFLNYFLDRDLSSVAERVRASEPPAHARGSA